MSADYLPEVIPPTPKVDVMTKDTPTKEEVKPQEVVEEHEPADDLVEGGMTFDSEKDDIAPTLQVKPIIDDEEIFKEPQPKPKRKATEKQKEHLARCREKALAKRKAQGEATRLLKEEKQKEKDAKREIRVEAIRQREARKEEKEALKKPSVSFSSQPSFSKDDILKIQEDAINNYETKRKARKAEKKKSIEKETHDKKVYEAVSKAVGGTNPDDIWSTCFQ
jgi:hypothetical protein